MELRALIVSITGLLENMEREGKDGKIFTFGRTDYERDGGVRSFCTIGALLHTGCMGLPNQFAVCVHGQNVTCSLSSNRGDEKGDHGSAGDAFAPWRGRDASLFANGKTACPPVFADTAGPIPSVGHTGQSRLGRR
jgi:hypothetical protein